MTFFISLLIITFSVYGVMLFVTIPEVMRFSNDLKIPDLMPTGYSPEYIATFLDTIGEGGRYAYLYHQLPLDFFYPGLLTLTLILSIHKIYGRLKWSKKTIGMLMIPALIGGISDYAENLGMVYLLIKYPLEHPGLSFWMNIATISKSSFTSIAFMIVIGGLIWMWFSKRRNWKI